MNQKKETETQTKAQIEAEKKFFVDMFQFLYSDQVTYANYIQQISQRYNPKSLYFKNRTESQSREEDKQQQEEDDLFGLYETIKDDDGDEIFIINQIVDGVTKKVEFILDVYLRFWRNTNPDLIIKVKTPAIIFNKVVPIPFTRSPALLIAEKSPFLSTQQQNQKNKKIFLCDFVTKGYLNHFYSSI